MNTDSNIRVVAVCGSEARIYGIAGSNPNIRRPLINIRQFSNRGQALDFASDFEAKERGLSRKTPA